MDELHPLVSVIMPAYNAEAFIGESIRSVQAQTWQQWELVVIDDGSTDKTAQVIQEAGKEDVRIKYVWQANGRQGKARNLGLKVASGKIIAFLDADDLWYPHHLSTQLSQLIAQDVDLVFSGADLFPINKDRYPETIGGNLIFLHGQQGISEILKSNIIPILTVVAFRDAIEKVKGFNEHEAYQNLEDYDLWVRMLQNGCCMSGISQVTAAYRIHPQSNWSSSDELTNIQKHFWFFRQLWQTGEFSLYATLFSHHFNVLGNRLFQLYASNRNVKAIWLHWNQAFTVDKALAIKWLPFMMKFFLAQLKAQFR